MILYRVVCYSLQKINSENLKDDWFYDIKSSWLIHHKELQVNEKIRINDIGTNKRKNSEIPRKNLKAFKANGQNRKREDLKKIN